MEHFRILQALGVKIDYICREENPALFTHGVRDTFERTHYSGVPTITEQELLAQHRDADVVIGDIECAVAADYLRKAGFPAGRLWRRHTQWEPQYLDPEIMKPHEHEVYIDGGVLDLANTLEFIEWCGGKYDAVYAFEPDPDSYRFCLSRIEGDPRLDKTRVHLQNAALWKKDDTLCFASGNQGGSSLNADGNTMIQARSVDSVLQGTPVTLFIKLDIEGAELDALYGARQTIKNGGPGLRFAFIIGRKISLKFHFISMALFQSIKCIYGIIRPVGPKQYYIASVIKNCKRCAKGDYQMKRKSGRWGETAFYMDCSVQNDALIEKNYAIEFYRFLFCCVVIFLHFRDIFGFELFGDTGMFSGGYLGVEFFFITSGCLMMRNMGYSPALAHISVKNSAETETRYFLLNVSKD